MKTKTRWKNTEVLVLGLARSGTEAARLLYKLGADVTANDHAPYEGNVQAQELEKLGIKVVCGGHPPELLHSGLKALVKNPGIRYDHPIVEKAVHLGIPVLTEIQPAFDAADCPIISVTGSNGKTTTTSYIGEMFQEDGPKAVVAGNIGRPVSEAVQNTISSDVLVMELSSFQLLGIDTFRPNVAVLLNLIDAHLDYHGSRDEYIRAKKQIFRYQTSDDYLVYNEDDPVVVEMVKDSPAHKVPFSLKHDLPEGACVKKQAIWLFGKELLSLKEFSLPGEHNTANALAAAAAASIGGASTAQIRKVLRTFSGVEHRLQFIKEWDGRRFYNNSKATNVPATITALKAFEEPVILLGGGLDRGLSFDELKQYMGKVKAVFTYGETAEKIAETARQSGVKNVNTFEILKDAVKEAVEYSEGGEVILLSPSCASWDQYRTFEERGESFIRIVEQLTAENSNGGQNK